MSTTTIDMARSSFSFAQLVRRLRHTNARYDQIAIQFRCRIRPTHHAKRRACRAGLRIDTSKARACPEKHISTHPPPVLDRSADPDSVDTLDTMYATAETGSGIEGHGIGQGDAYTRDPALRNLPEIVVREPRTRDGHKRVILRLPPLKLPLNLDYPSGAAVSQFQGPAPGAPRLQPRQLPDVEYGVDELTLECSPSSIHDLGAYVVLTPFDPSVYSGLCITIPPRNSKRKFQDVEADGDATTSQQPKRVLRARWDEFQRQ